MSRQSRPYIYSTDEVISLMKQADTLLSPDGLRAMAVRTAIGLLWATGLRVGELCRLYRDDVHLKHRELHVRNTKFHKERYLPIHPTVVEALKVYAEFRDHRYPHSTDPHFSFPPAERRFPKETWNTAFPSYARVCYQQANVSGTDVHQGSMIYAILLLAPRSSAGIKKEWTLINVFYCSPRIWGMLNQVIPTGI